MAPPLDAAPEPRHLRFLADAGGLFLAALDPETILRNLARLAVPDVADACIVDVRDEDGRIRRVAVAHIDPTRADRAWEAHASAAPERVPEAIRTSRPLLLPEMGDEGFAALARGPEDAQALRALGLSSAVAAPLVARESTLGAIVLASIDGGRRWDETDLAFAVTVAQRAAMAVDNARLYRRAQEAGRMKDEFLATLSHELRAPLNAIVGWAHVLRAGSLDSAVTAKAVDAIDRNAVLQTHLLSSILDLSRIATGRLRLDLVLVPPSAVVEAAVAAVRGEAEARGVTVQTSLDATVGPVSADPERLQQVVANLLSNALRFTPRGGRIDVRLRAALGQARIEVQDTGAGISPEMLPRVFDRFRSAEGSTTRAPGGVGLGLAIVRHLVELHGGTVDAASRGRCECATFTVTLPISAVPPPAARPLPGREATLVPRRPETAAAVPALDGVRVLVVDDEKETRDVISAVLEQTGARVVTASSVREAMARLALEVPDVVLGDIGMPEEDGYSLMRRIRGLPTERGGAVPAAALTAYARAEDRMQALLAGYQVHVPKPVQPSDLIRVVAALAARRSAARVP